MKYIISHFLLFTILLLGAIALFYLYGKNIWMPYYKKYCTTQIQTVKVIKKECQPCPTIEYNQTEPKIVEKECPTCPICPEPEILIPKQKLFRHLANSNFIRYPKKLTLIGLKYEQQLEVWGEDNGVQHLIAIYPFTSFSGILGPKFKEGDRQIPEGIYGISYLNPNSKFHLSMRVNYPNAFDKKMAKKEHRSNLGGDIMIHGSNRTIGCIPIGDENIEQLYFLAEKVGIQNIKVILAPVDFRKMNVNITKANKHPWLRELYDKIKKEMEEFKK